MTILGNRSAVFLRKGAMPLCLALLLNGCSVISYRTCPSFVTAYEHLYAIHLQEWSDHERFLLITAKINGFERSAFNLEGEKKAVYDALCTKHNDLNYPHRVELEARIFPVEDIFIDTDFVSVSLVTDADYDAAHPAGADLSDIVRFISCSPYPFIKSGYSAYYHFDAGEFPEGVEDIWSCYMGASEKLKPEWDNPYHLIDKRLEDLTAEDLTLLGPGWPYWIGFLYFEELPSVPGSYPMTVRMTTDSGEVFEDSATMNF